jgi:hypothetical protein
VEQRCEFRQYDRIEWTSELQGEHKLARAGVALRYQGSWLDSWMVTEFDGLLVFNQRTNEPADQATNTE